MAAIACCLLFLVLAAGMLWFQDWRYSLPTPRPARLVQVPLGDSVKDALGTLGALPAGDGRPLFLSFFSPDCPCSRFALEHLRALVRAHALDTRFVAVIEGEAAGEHESATGLDLAEFPDAGGRLAGALGVYATPQAVIVSAAGTLWYRGNYNASRYCTEPASAFARLALEALLAGAPRPAFPPAATLAYGCALQRAEDAP